MEYFLLVRCDRLVTSFTDRLREGEMVRTDFRCPEGLSRHYFVGEGGQGDPCPQQEQKGLHGGQEGGHGGQGWGDNFLGKIWVLNFIFSGVTSA